MLHLFQFISNGAVSCNSQLNNALLSYVLINFTLKWKKENLDFDQNLAVLEYLSTWGISAQRSRHQPKKRKRKYPFLLATKTARFSNYLGRVVGAAERCIPRDKELNCLWVRRCERGRPSPHCFLNEVSFSPTKINLNGFPFQHFFFLFRYS